MPRPAIAAAKQRCCYTKLLLVLKSMNDAVQVNVSDLSTLRDDLNHGG